jgi:hypothetical protein
MAADPLRAVWVEQAFHLPFIAGVRKRFAEAQPL